MGPRSNPLWEFHSLAFWWATWTLADTYLLPFTPLSEIAVVWICLVIAGVARLAACISSNHRYTERIDGADLDPPPPPKRSADNLDVIIDAV
tara:strand:+ start:331 stop:606 length:276 start_codon:yes stop_codon:yes gene_type:complete